MNVTDPASPLRWMGGKVERRGQSFAFSTQIHKAELLVLPSSVCFNNWGSSLEELGKLKCIRKHVQKPEEMHCQLLIERAFAGLQR